MTQIKTKSAAIDLSLPVKQSTSSCCGTTEDGAAVCVVPKNGNPSACGSNQESSVTLSDSGTLKKQEKASRKIRSILLFVVACLASPCCTPLYVPLVLVLLAGTPIAVWLSAHIGWTYGILTIVSIISFVLAFRWWPKLSGKRRSKTAVSVEPQSLPKTN